MNNRDQPGSAEVRGDNRVLRQPVERACDCIRAVIVDDDELVGCRDFARHQIGDVQTQCGIRDVDRAGDVQLVVTVGIDAGSLVTIQFNRQR